MARVRQKGTAAELAVRRALWDRGLRYRLNVRALPGSPDIVFPGSRVAIFVHGCFWHGHDCPRGQRRPRTNVDYWLQKVERNSARDARVEDDLTKLGWLTMVVWECEPPAKFVEAVRELVVKRARSDRRSGDHERDNTG